MGIQMKRLLLLSFKNRLSDILFSLFASYYSFALLRRNARLYQSPASTLLLAGFIANPEIQAGARLAGTCIVCSQRFGLLYLNRDCYHRPLNYTVCF